MSRKINEQFRQELRASEREKDTIHYLSFTPLDGREVVHTTLLNDDWCVRLPRNPEGDPEIIEDAMRIFEAKHNVDSWRKVAIRYKASSLYYP